jgi:hypothetical protein
MTTSNPDAEHGIFVNLRGNSCACGDWKKAGKSFCRPHYFQLPLDLRDGLYDGEGYVDTYRRCLLFLKLQEPKAPAPRR